MLSLFSRKSSDKIIKKYKIPYFGALFAEIWAKMSFLQNYALPVLGWKNNVTSWKTTVPKENVKLIERRIDGQLNKSDFIRHSVYRSIQRKLDLILSSGYVAHLSFWSNLGMPIHARQSPNDLLLTYKKSILCLNSFYRLSRILKSDQLRAQWAITQGLEFFQT